jgi:hypothetical protein
MKLESRVMVFLTLVTLGGVHLLDAQICYKCVSGNCVLTQERPSTIFCTGGGFGSCQVSGWCQPDGPSAVNAAGTVSSPVASESFGPNSPAARPATMASHLASRSMAPGTTWHTNCRGVVIARSIRREQAAELRKHLRLIRA